MSTRPNSITAPLPLFDPRPIDVRFEQFNADHPEVYRLLVRFCRELKDAGRSHYSVDALFHRLRWYYHVEKRAEEPFKLNDHYTSRYARLISAQETDLANFFETRRLRAQ
ncbi:MAG: hypothetical protein M3P27_13440 [Acidobacteriota bacterium]|nr:hypothetical protein [Acidobacteriota bacterium]